MFFNSAKQNRQAYYERAFRRGELPAWDARWEKLSVAARQELLKHIKTSRQQYRRPSGQPPVAAERFTASVLEELVAAGFVTVRNPTGGEKGRKVMLVADAVDFIERMRALLRYRVLDEQQPEAFRKYLNYCFTKYELLNEIGHVLRRAELDPYTLFGDVFELYVASRHWPGWVAAYLDDALAGSIVEVIDRAGGRMPLAEVASQLPQDEPARVRAALEKLITRLALFEDLDPETYEIQVGLLPAVRANRRQADSPRPRPPLEPAQPPAEPGPEGGTDIPDLRAVLLELAGTPARLRQDHSLFQKEWERFGSVLEPLPNWLEELYQLTVPRRLDIVLHWAKRLGLTTEKKENDRPGLQLSAAGQHWLARRIEDQYAFIYERLREGEGPTDTGFYPDDEYSDGWFLGLTVSAVPLRAGRRRRSDYFSPLTAAQRQPLREALFAAFAQLPLGVFHRLDHFIDWTIFGPHNPLLLGRKPEEVEVLINGRFVAPLEEQRREAARHLLRHLVSNRLIPMGCLQAGHDASGELLIARRPRLDTYFGHPAPAAPAPENASAATRVVVQPDFSIIVIGTDLSVAAELAPFCERVRERSGGGGAVTLRLSRASVVKASTAGLSAAEILDRLQRHASTPVPGNVAHEVREWAGWVRLVSAESVTLFRCPDAATADRVVAVLGRPAEKLSPTLVACPHASLSDTDRRKLREQGIILGASAATTPAREPGKKGRRR